MRKIRISVGIPAYNEEKNITELLNAIASQKTRIAEIEKIFVINDGSTDSTRQKVEEFIKSGKLRGKIELINRKFQGGKWVAINTFLKKAKSPILILESADNLPGKGCYELLAKNFLDEKIGIVCSRIIPLNDENTFFGSAAHLMYELHHEISLQQPKFGELIAFRHIIKKIPKTIVDEEEIVSIFRDKNYNLVYNPKAIVYNKAPENLGDLINQRRRIYCGHLDLKKRKNYEASTLPLSKILKTAFKKINKKNLLPFFILFEIELLSRTLGYLDYLTNREKHVKWKQIKSVKNLEIDQTF